jgi:hypothetical protein
VLFTADSPRLPYQNFVGLGPTPVAIADMDAVTRRLRLGQGVLVVPMVGAFFIDMLNVVTITLFLGFMTGWTGSVRLATPGSDLTSRPHVAAVAENPE